MARGLGAAQIWAEQSTAMLDGRELMLVKVERQVTDLNEKGS